MLDGVVTSPATLRSVHTDLAEGDAVVLDPGGGGGYSYPAHMQPISFPTGAATKAKSACERIASLLDDHLSARPNMVSECQDGWEGAYRDEFDDTWRIQEHRLVGLKDDLRTLAGKIQTAMDDAETLNNQRATMREEYREDYSELAGAN